MLLEDTLLDNLRSSSICTLEGGDFDEPQDVIESDGCI